MQITLAWTAHGSPPMRPLALGLVLLCPPLAARAAPSITIAPPQSHISFTLYALGVLPVTGEFQQFHGVVTTSSGPPAQCQVQVSLATASLHLPSPGWTSRALSPEMLNAPSYPTIGFTGGCAPTTTTGSLTLHGVTHPFALHVRQDGAKMIATGRLNRTDFGITGLPFILGQDIRITVTVPAAAVAARPLKVTASDMPR